MIEKLSKEERISNLESTVISLANEVMRLQRMVMDTEKPSNNNNFDSESFLKYAGLGKNIFDKFIGDIDNSKRGR